MFELRREKLKKLAEKAGGSAALAKQYNLNPDYLYQLIGGRRNIGEKSARNLERSLHLPDRWLDSENGEVEVTAESLKSVEINLDSNPAYPSIRRVRFKLSAGTGGFGIDYDGEDTVAPIVFAKAWYSSRNLEPSKLFAVKVANGSMESGLYDGDTVVVNTAQTTPKDGVVFAANFEGQLVIKRLQRDAGEWWLSSDNPDQRRYPRKICDENTFIIGEIVHKQSERI